MLNSCLACHDKNSVYAYYDCYCTLLAMQNMAFKVFFNELISKSFATTGIQ